MLAVVMGRTESVLVPAFRGRCLMGRCCLMRHSLKHRSLVRRSLVSRRLTASRPCYHGASPASVMQEAYPVTFWLAIP